MNSGGFKIKITVLDRVVLHLYNFRSFEGNSEMAEETTQHGIAQGININYSHVPRAVKNLISSGLINEITAHSSAKPGGRRRKAYYLTEKGMMIADKMLNNLKDMQILVEDEAHNSAPMTLGQLKQYLKTDKDMLFLFQFISSENIFNINDWENQIKPGPIEKTISNIEFRQQLGKNLSVHLKKWMTKLYEEGIILEPSALTFIPDFVNRDTEIKVLKTALADEASNLFFLTGPTGIGKTTTLSKCLVDFFNDPDHVVKQKSLLWFNASKFGSGKDFLNSMLENFNPNGDLDNSNNLNFKIKEFLRLISNEYSIMIFDDLNILENDSRLDFELDQTIEQQDPMAVLLEHLIEIVQSKKGKEPFKIAITTAQDNVGDYFKQRYGDMAKTKLTINIKLDGLDLTSVKQFFGSALTPEFAEAIHQLTDGNPLIIRTIKNIDKSTLNEFQQQPVDDGALALVLKAQNILNLDKDE